MPVTPDWSPAIQRRAPAETGVFSLRRIEEDMKKNETVRLYNILLPLWLLLFWPSALWLVLIPANYLIDRFVLRWSLGEMPEKGAFCGAGEEIRCAARADHGAVPVLLPFRAALQRAVKYEIMA